MKATKVHEVFLRQFFPSCPWCPSWLKYSIAIEQVETKSLLRWRPCFLSALRFDCFPGRNYLGAIARLGHRKNQKFILGGNPAKTLLDGTFQQACGSEVASFHRSNSFIVGAQFLPSQNVARLYFEGLADGTRHALLENRRSGAQRGAPENNFGQRFSWAPLA
jgi:hypothetical protein